MSVHRWRDLWAKVRFARHGKDTPPFDLRDYDGSARVVSVYDGDTMQAVVPVGKRYWRFSVRLAGIDTAEMRDPDPAIRAAAVAARGRLLELLAGSSQACLEDRVCIVRLVGGTNDKYGRVLGTVYNADGIDVAQALLSEGHARPYAGGRRGQGG